MALRVIINSLFSIPVFNNNNNKQKDEELVDLEIGITNKSINTLEPEIMIDIQSYELCKVFDNYYTIKPKKYQISDVRYNYMEKGTKPIKTINK